MRSSSAACSETGHFLYDPGADVHPRQVDLRQTVHAGEDERGARGLKLEAAVVRLLAVRPRSRSSSAPKPSFGAAKAREHPQLHAFIAGSVFAHPRDLLFRYEGRHLLQVT